MIIEVITGLLIIGALIAGITLIIIGEIGQDPCDKRYLYRRLGIARIRLTPSPYSVESRAGSTISGPPSDVPQGSRCAALRSGVMTGFDARKRLDTLGQATLTTQVCHPPDDFAGRLGRSAAVIWPSHVLPGRNRQRGYPTPIDGLAGMDSYVRPVRLS